MSNVSELLEQPVLVLPDASVGNAQASDLRIPATQAVQGAKCLLRAHAAKFAPLVTRSDGMGGLTVGDGEDVERDFIDDQVSDETTRSQHLIVGMRSDDHYPPRPINIKRCEHVEPAGGLPL